MSLFTVNYSGSNGLEFARYNTKKYDRDMIFREGTELPNVNLTLLRSWQRSRVLNIDPNIDAAPWVSYEPKSDLEILLFDVARPYFNYFGNLLGLSNCVLSLVNSEGIIIYTKASDKKFQKIMEKHNHLVNSLWDEKSVGTNPLNMVLEEKKTVFMEECDFYSYSFQQYAGIASPIFCNKDKEIIGVLSVVSYKGMLNMHSLGWNASLAKMIEIELGRHIMQLSRNSKSPLLTSRSNTVLAKYLPGVIGKDPAFIEVLKLAGKAAKTDLNILLTGETGTGKEVLAKAIHKNSTRASGPFVAVNCGAIPKELLGSELFGYQEGAFTGAARRGYPGRFEQADGGTLLLDEIGDAPYEVQIALLRVLEEGLLYRLGSVSPTPVNVRILAATSRDLKMLVKDEKFRLDLYFRLSGINIRIPPLRERKEDILFIAEHFLQISREKRGRCFEFDDKLIEAFLEYDWPGNVRELKNAIDRLIVFEENEQVSADLFYKLVQSKAIRKPCSLEQNYKRDSLMQQIKEANGNISKVAKKLGVNRLTIYRWMDKYGIDKEKLIWSEYAK